MATAGPSQLSQASPTLSRASRQLSRADRRAVILWGAAEAFAEAGYAATSMEDIASASGITKLIVYRHFDSKEALYRAVLQQVFDRLADDFLTAYSREPHSEGVGPRSLLTVARENPAGFRLLWRHAAREPQFAAYASELRDHAVDASRALLKGVVEPALHEWAAQTVMSFLVEATLNWLEHGDPARDEEFVGFVTEAVRLGLQAGRGR